MTASNQLARTDDRPQTLAVSDTPTPAQMIMSTLDMMRQSGATKETVEALALMADLHNKQEDRNAEKSFNRAMVECQREIGKVVATTKGPLGFYAKLEELQDQANPILEKFGFAVNFREGQRDATRATIICVVRHIDGHKEEYPFAVREVPTNRGTNEAQADLSTNTYGKRRAFANAFNIRIDNSDDARALGQPVDGHTAARLLARAKLTVADNMLVNLWGQFGALKPEEIPSGKVPELEAMLARRESKKGIKYEPENISPNDPDQPWSE